MNASESGSWMIVLQRRVYCAALLLWMLSIVLFPTEIGQGYWFGNAARVSLGVLVLGVVMRVWNWWTGPKELDPVVAMAWSLSLWQVITWPCLIFSGAWLVSGDWAAGILSAGLLAGLFYGVWSLRVQAASKSLSTTTNVPVTCELVSVSQELSGRKRTPISDLAGFTLGLFSALCLFVAIVWVASFFRGPIIGRNGFSPHYANDQLLVNLGGGLAIMTIGWGTAVMLQRLKAQPGLTWGIIAGATPLGLAFACGM